MGQTPEQLQFFSNVGHTIEGTLLALVGLIAFVQALGYLKSQNAQYLWPALIVTAGLFLPVYLVLQDGFGQIAASWSFVIHDPQQRQHIFMAMLLVLAGSAELAVRSKLAKPEFWKFVAPAMLVAIGIALLLHTQYGTPQAMAESMRKHHYQGIAVILVGVSRVAELLWGRAQKWLTYPWIIFLCVGAVLLLTYREPWGAYRNSDGSLNDVIKREIERARY